MTSKAGKSEKCKSFLDVKVRSRDIAKDRKQKEEQSRGQYIKIGSAFIFLKIKVETTESGRRFHK